MNATSPTLAQVLTTASRPPAATGQTLPGETGIATPADGARFIDTLHRVLGKAPIEAPTSPQMIEDITEPASDPNALMQALAALGVVTMPAPASVAPVAQSDLDTANASVDAAADTPAAVRAAAARAPVGSAIGATQDTEDGFTAALSDQLAAVTAPAAEHAPAVPKPATEGSRESARPALGADHPTDVADAAHAATATTKASVTADALKGATAADTPAIASAALERTPRAESATALDANAAPPSTAIGHAAAVPSTAMQTLTTSATIEARMGTPAWAAQVTEQVKHFVLNKIEVAELRLNPQELGPIRVEIALDQGQAAIHFAAARDDVRDALAQNLGHLRNALSESGLSLQNATTGNLAQDGQAWNFMQQQRQQAQTASPGSTAASAAGSAEVDPATTSVARAPVAPRANGVDLFA